MGGQMGLQPQHMCCATTYILVPIYQAGNTLRRGLQGRGEMLSLSESVRGGQMTWRMSRMMRMKLRDVWGQKTFIFELGDREDTCGFLYYEDRSTGATLKQSTYQIPRSFTTCACAIFMGQRNNNNNDPCGSWALPQWLTEQRGREGRHQNKSPGGPKDDGTESERGAEWSMQSCDRVDWRWPGLAWGLESEVGGMLI